MEATDHGHRERKKLRTRRQIQSAALTLFAERGYQAATISAIAHAADVAPRTVSLYFPSKLEMFFGDGELDTKSLSTFMREAGDVVDGLRRWVEAQIDVADREIEELRVRAIEHDPWLRAHQRERLDAFEDEIARAVSQHTNQPPRAVGPRIFAAAATEAILSFRDFVHGDDPEGFQVSYEQAFTLLSSLYTDLTRR